MATHYVDLNGPNGGGTGPLDTRNTVPNGSVGDVILFPGGSTQVHTAQRGIVTQDITWGSYATPAGTRSRHISTATNFGQFNVDAAGTIKFRDLWFDQCLTMAADGGVIVASKQGGTGRASSLDLERCKFTATKENAIRINGTDTATAALTFRSVNCEYDDIGQDCIFGGALDYEAGYNRATRISTRTLLGDFVGFINADPNRVWVHHNYVDHSSVDAKQCVIIDTVTPGAGLAIIEDNVLIGYGNGVDVPTRHLVVICEAVMKLRRNLITGYGPICGLNNVADEISGNVIQIGNTAPGLGVPIALMANGGRLVHNTIVGIGSLAAGTAAAVMGATGGTAAEVRNNAFVNLPIAIQSNAASNPTCTHNGFQNVGVQRTGQSGAFAGANDVTGDLQLAADYRPQAASPLIAAGTPLAGLRDRLGAEYWRNPTIGAYEYQRARTARV